MSSLISVVIPMKNRASTILRAVRSAQIQAGPFETEILVVDDGSTDESIKIVKDLIADDNRIRLLVNDRTPGAPGARNTGISASKGAYVALLDSDDEFLAGKLERQLLQLSKNSGAVACFSRFNYIYSAERIKPGTLGLPFNVEQLFRSNVLGGCSSALIRMDSLRSICGFREGLPSCQDWELWLRLSTLGELILVDECLVNYHFDEEFRISKNSARVLAGHSVVYDLIREIQPQLVSNGELDRAFALRYAEIFSSHIFSPGRAMRNSFAAWDWKNILYSTRVILRTGYRIGRQIRQKLA